MAARYFFAVALLLLLQMYFNSLLPSLKEFLQARLEHAKKFLRSCMGITLTMSALIRLKVGFTTAQPWLNPFFVGCVFSGVNDLRHDSG